MRPPAFMSHCHHSSLHSCSVARVAACAMRRNYPLPWGERLDALYGPGARPGLERLGRSVGFKFNFSAPGSNTFDSHRLLLWAEDQGPPTIFDESSKTVACSL